MRKVKLVNIFMLILLQATPVLVKSQQERYIDSLKNLASVLSGEKRIDKLILISRRYLDLRMDEDFEKYRNLAEKESRELHYQKGIAGCFNLKGVFYERKADFSNCIKSYELALQLRKEIKDSAGISGILNNMAISFVDQGRLSQAIEYHLQALHMRESLRDTVLIGQSLNNIGNVYSAMGNNLKSLEYYQKAYRLGELSKNGWNIGTSLSNLGIVYTRMGNYDLARDYIEKSIPYFDKAGNEDGKTNAYLNIGDILMRQKKYKEAERFTETAIALKKKDEDEIGLATAYLTMGQIKRDEGKPDAAVSMFSSSAEISKKIGNSLGLCTAQLELAATYLAMANHAEAIRMLAEVLRTAQKKKYHAEIRDAYGQLSKVKAKMNDYPGAYKYLQLYQALNDSLNKESSARQLNELSASFENEKKEKEIELLKKTQTLKELQVKNQQSEISKQRLYIIFSAVAILLAILSLGLLANRYYLKKKSGDALFKAYSELSEKNSQITDSINYAQRLQNAMLPGEEEIKKFLPNSSIFFRPKDIVSGDFYWFSRIGNKNIIVAADCTGHGVPGALMSMVGNTLLNQVVNEQRVEDPGDILTQLNKRFYRIFSGNKTDEEADGMDMSVCVIDPDSGTVRFAGANQSLFLVNGEKTEIIAGDVHSIGGVFSTPDAVFTTRTLTLHPGNSVCLSTDGFFDQLGGESYKKYQASKFAGLIEGISRLNPDEQKEMLAREFDSWKGGRKQNDDVLVWNITV